MINDTGIFPTTDDNEELLVQRLTDVDFRKLVQSLNIEQKEFFYHVLSSVKIGYGPLRLDRDRLNTIRCQLQKLQVIFIDEISMVGSGMFNFLNLRLQQIMGSKEPFGGVIV